MIAEPDPQKVFAVVVGIEKYDYGPGWNLDGPALDCAHFIDWLCSWNVPIDQIFAFLSPLETNCAEVDRICAKAGVAYQAAKQSNIRKVFANTLTIDAQTPKKGDLLFIFWGGHGVVTEGMQRRLFYADATKPDKLNLDFGSLLRAGRFKSYAGFPFQVGIIDTCANYFEEMRTTLEMQGDEIPRANLPAQGVTQLVMFASAAGEVAVNNNLKRSGAFSDFVLSKLKKPGAHVQFPGLADFVDLNAECKQHFADLRKNEKSRQTPVHFFADDSDAGGGAVPLGVMPGPEQMQRAARRWDLSIRQIRSLIDTVLQCKSMQEAAKRIALVNSLEPAVRAAILPLPDDAQLAVQRILSVALDRVDLKPLFDALAAVEPDTFAVQKAAELADRLLWVATAAGAVRQAPVPQGQFNKLYYLSAPDTQTAPLSKDLDEMLEKLADMGTGSLAEFMARIQAQAPVPPVDDWLSTHVSAPQLAEIRAKLRVEQKTKRERPYLSIAVQTVNLKPGEKPSVEAWLWNESDSNVEHWLETWERSDESRGLESLRTATRSIVDKAQALAASDLAIEFLVPREQFNLAPESWDGVDDYNRGSLLGQDYEVVLRWRDRVYEPAKARSIDWRRRAESIQQRQKAGLQPSLLPVPQAKFTFRTLREALIESQDCGDCVTFLYVPPDTPMPAEDLIVAALLGGAPYLLWTRHNPDDWHELEQAVTDLAKVGLDNLPQAIRKWRQNSSSPWKGQMTIIWDCPSHLPKIERGTPAGVK